MYIFGVDKDLPMFRIAILANLPDCITSIQSTMRDHN